MGKKYDFNYIVIGSGPAGSAAALTLAKAKKRVALIEGGNFGGANLNTRDIPYKVALDFAHTYYKISYSPEFKNQELSFNFPTVVAHQLKAIIESDGGNNKKVFEDTGIICINGYANFLDNNTIAVGEQKFTAQNFILATGAHLDTSTVHGVENVNYLTPDTALKVRRLPKAVFVIGGGSTGCEIAEYYAMLGTKVLIAEKSPRLLPTEDSDVSQEIMDHFDSLGITVLPNSKVLSIEQDDLSKRVIFQNNGSEKLVRVDCIVLATGSKPITDYGLENTNVKFVKPGELKIDRYFQTSAKNIFAIGDCVSKVSSTDRADYEGRLLASNLINKTKNIVNYKGFARITNTSPAVVTIGLSESDLKRNKQKYKKSIVYLKDIPAGKIYDSKRGLVKILTNRMNRIIGACIVAPNAESMSSELSLAVRHNLTSLEVASTPHGINDFNYAIKLAAQKSITNKK